jgi:hypothetical protein
MCRVQSQGGRVVIKLLSRSSWLVAIVGIILCWGCVAPAPPPAPPDNERISGLIVELVESQTGMKMSNATDPVRQITGFSTVIVRSITVGSYKKRERYYPVSVELVSGKRMPSGEVEENKEKSYLDFRGYTLPGTWHFKLFPPQEKEGGWSMAVD